MNNRSKFSGMSFTFLLIFILFFNVYGQDEFPTNDYRGDEFVSLNNSIPFNVAIDILNQFCRKYENKVIIDPKQRQIPIGVVIDNMYWRKALDYILGANNLSYKTFDQFYEIQDEPGTNIQPGSGGLIISTDTKEVLIEATFFEADKKTLNQLGVDWTTFKNGKLNINVNNIENMTNNSISGLYMWTNGTINVYALMEALENTEKGDILSQPQIQVMESTEGKVKVGKTFYLTVRDFSGNTRYREYEAGTILTVIPKVITIRDTTFLHLNLKTEKSEIVPSFAGIVKEISESRTQVLLLNGEQTAIAGLYSTEIRRQRSGIPFLKNLPGWFLGLRYIFGYNSTEEKKKELVILVKASIAPQLSKRKVDTRKQELYQNSLQKRLKEGL